MKVKLFSDSYLSELEKRVNEFLLNDNYNMVDIKYQDGNTCYSVLIIYYEIKGE